MTRRAHARQPHLKRFSPPLLLRQLADLEARSDLDERARLLAEFDLLDQEFAVPGPARPGEQRGDDGLRRPAWALLGEHLQSRHAQGQLVAGIQADAEADFPLEEALFTTADIEGAIREKETRLGEYDGLRSDATDPWLRVYVWPDGTHLAFERHPRAADRWRHVTMTAEELGAFHGRPVEESKPFVPPPADELRAQQLQDLTDELGKLGTELGWWIRDGAEHLEEDRQRLDVAIAHAGDDVHALREVLLDALRVVEKERERRAEEDRRVAERQQELASRAEGGVDLPPDDEDVPDLRVLRGGDEEHAADGDADETLSPDFSSPEAAPPYAAGAGFPTVPPNDPPPAAPEPDPPVAPADEPGAPEEVGPPASGNVGGAEAAPALPPCLEFESAMEAAERAAADITDDGARNRALAALSACLTVDEIHAKMRKILANLAEQAKADQKRARARAETDAYLAAAKAEHEKNKAKAAAEKPKGTALGRSRERVRGSATMEAAKVDPGVKALRSEVLELVREVFAPGTPPRDLVDEIKEADYQALTIKRGLLELQVEEKRKRPPAVADEVDLRGVLPQEGE